MRIKRISLLPTFLRSFAASFPVQLWHTVTSSRVGKRLMDLGNGRGKALPQICFMLCNHRSCLACELALSILQMGYPAVSTCTLLGSQGLKSNLFCHEVRALNTEIKQYPSFGLFHSASRRRNTDGHHACLKAIPGSSTGSSASEFGVTFLAGDVLNTPIPIRS